MARSDPKRGGARRTTFELADLEGEAEVEWHPGKDAVRVSFRTPYGFSVSALLGGKEARKLGSVLVDAAADALNGVDELAPGGE